MQTASDQAHQRTHNANSSRQIFLHPGQRGELVSGKLLAMVVTPGGNYKESGLFHVHPGDYFYGMKVGQMEVSYLPLVNSDYALAHNSSHLVPDQYMASIMPEILERYADTRSYCHWRVLKYLYDCAGHPDRVLMHDWIEVRCIRSNIGVAISATREMVGRVLKDLIAEGLVREGRTSRYAMVPTDEWSRATYDQVYAKWDNILSTEHINQRVALMNKNRLQARDNGNQTGPRRDSESSAVGADPRIEPVLPRNGTVDASDRLQDQPERQRNSETFGFGWD